MLDSEEVVRLNGLIRDSFRIRPNQKPKYVDVSNHLARLRSRQHQVVFGRRGSGKSCLFVHFLNDSDAHNNVLPIYVDEVKCRVPDDWLLHNRRGLLMGREVLRAVMAGSSVRGGVAC